MAQLTRWRFLAPLAWSAALSVGVLSAGGSAFAQAADYVWWEGEAAAAHNFPRNGPFGAHTLGENAKLLSGGEWLNGTGKAAGPVQASWTVAVPADGEYAFWARKFWKHGPFKWRFDSMPAGEWRVCGPNIALADDTPLRKFVGANWVSLGSVKLPKGQRTFQVELLTEPGKEWTAGFDCFVLSRGPFTPNGKTRPGEKVGRADEGYFPFEPDADPFRPDALLDLRSLNEPAAGQAGFLRRDGGQIVLGNGAPVRFWAVNLSLGNAQQDRSSVDYLARKLAKQGVNMVRFHSPLWDDADPAQIDPKKLDALHYLVAAMKKQGIYTSLSFYFPVWADGQKLGLTGFENQADKKPFALLFFNEKLQALHRNWLRQILTAPNPYANNTPLSREPALGMVEVQNEDSLFFWTFGRKNIPAFHWDRLEAMFNQWLTKKYGSPGKALTAWNNEKANGDAPDRAALYEVFHMTSAGVKQGGAGKARRVGDQVQFLAELQRGFYASATKYLKSDLQLGGLVVPGNWTTADPMLLGAVERWTYTAGDVLDTHGYFEPEHKGDGAAYSVRVGHSFKDRAPAQSPTMLPIRFQPVDGYPQIISEIGFTQPNRYRVDGVFVASAYSALQGIDGVFLFAVNSNYLRDTSINKFQVASPAVVQSFPAAALVYRRGDVKEAQPAVYQVTPTADLWALKGSGGWSADALDAFRKLDVPAGVDQVAGQVDKVDPLTPYVGPVVRSFAEGGKSWQRDPTKHIDREARSVVSLTGELKWEYGVGVVTMNTPRAQGAAGFLQQSGEIRTADLSIRWTSDFGSVTAVALDDQPIARSRRILLQVATQDQPLGFKTVNGVIQSLGQAPFGVTKVSGEVQVRLEENPAAPRTPAKVLALDANGYALPEPVQVKGAGGGVTISLRPDVLHYVITR
jgi:hypothetical protein